MVQQPLDMGRHGREAGGMETGFISCIGHRDLFTLGGYEAVAALEIEKIMHKYIAIIKVQMMEYQKLFLCKKDSNKVLHALMK
jgi:hypothetical protein